MKKFHFPLLFSLPLLAVSALSAQTVSVDKGTLSFSALAGGAKVTQQVTVNSSGGPANFTTFPNTAWLSVNPTTGTAPSALNITADPGALPASNTPYQGTVTIFGPNNNATVNVTLTVSNVAASPSSLQFTYQMGAPVPTPQPINLTGQATTFTASISSKQSVNWLTVTPSGNVPGAVNVSLVPSAVASLAIGSYNASVAIMPAGNAEIDIPVTLTVSAAPPITVSPTTVNLAFQIGGTNNNAQQNLTLSTTGSQGVAFSLINPTVDPNPAGRVWFTFTPSGGTIPANGNTQVTIGYDTTANLPAGTYSGKVTVSTPGGTPATQDILIKLLVSSSPLINVTPGSLSFTAQLNTASPGSQNLTVSSTSAQLPLTVSTNTNNSGNWLLAPGQGSTGSPIAVSVSAAGLVPGTYNGTVTITGVGAGNGPLNVPVTLKVSNDPVIVVSANGCVTPTINPSCSLVFPVQTGLPIALTGQTQAIRVTSSTGAPLNYTITTATTACGSTWLTTGALGADGTLIVTANPAGIASGTCQGSVSIAATTADTGAAAPNSPLVIPVTMYISPTPLLVYNQSALSFTAQVSGQAPAPQTITLSSTSTTDQLTYNVTFATQNGGSSWLLVGPLSGSTAAGSNTITVQVLPGLLSPGIYTGTITITAQGPGSSAVADSPVTIPVTFLVTAGTLTVSPTTLSFSLVAGSAPPTGGKQINVSSTGQALNYVVTTAVSANSGGVNWLGAAPSSGTTPGNFNVSADASRLSPGVYSGTVTITSLTPFTGSNPAIVPVTLTVTSGTISVSPTSLTFTQAPGAPAPPAQTVNVTFSPTVLPFTVTTSTKNGGSQWLTATVSTSNNTVQVSANAGNLAVGQYDGTVTVTASGAGSVDIPVRLNVVAAATLTVTPTTLTFNYVVGSSSAPAAKTVQVSTSADPSLFTATVQTDNGGNGWLQATPTSGTTPATVSIAVNPQGLAANTYTGKVTFASPLSTTPVTVNVTFTVAVVAPPVIRTVNNAASYFTGSISPGENIVIFGTGLGPTTLTQGHFTNGVLDTTIANTQVLFDGLPAPVIYVSDTVTSVMVPYEVAGRATTVIRVMYQGVSSDPLTYTVALAAPGIYSQNFSGKGPGVIRNGDGMVNGPGTPAAKNSAVFLIMTGEGVTNPPSRDGAAAPVDGTGLNHPLFTASATIGNVPANVEYIGSYPGIVYGAAQVNIRIPANAPSGTQELVITLTNGTSTFSTQQGLTITVQ